jgi:hypothetical protein
VVLKPVASIVRRRSMATTGTNWKSAESRHFRSIWRSLDNSTDDIPTRPALLRRVAFEPSGPDALVTLTVTHSAAFSHIAAPVRKHSVAPLCGVSRE